MSDLVERLRDYDRRTAACDMVEAADRIEALEAALVSQQEGAGKLLTDMVAAANKDSKIAADRIEALEAALRGVIVEFDNEERPLVWQSIARARAALAHEENA